MRNEIQKLFFQISGYSVVGLINFCISTLLFFLLVNIFMINYKIAFTTIYLLGNLLTYVLNFKFVFKPNEKLEFKNSLPKYILVYLLSYLLNISLLSFIVEEYNYNPFWTQMSILPVFVIFNFIGFKFWSLR